jgi:hypothetical protein
MRENGTRIKEVTSRIGMTKLVFNKTRELVTTSLKKKLKKKMVKSLIWPVALCGCDTWTMNRQEWTSLKAFELWV